MKALKELVRASQIPEIKKKLLFTAFILAVFRLAAHIPASGIDRQALRVFFAQSPFLSLLDIFSGGTLANFSILALGLGPYINASIIMQLLTLVFPRLKEMQREEGEAGREKINQYTRFLTVPLASLQALGMFALLRSQGIVSFLEPFSIFALVATMTAGTMFSVWLGELITERGLGNGVSILIFAGIAGRLPVASSQLLLTVQGAQIFSLASLVVMAFVVVGAIVIMNEATRRIPVQYARRAARGGTVAQQTHLPLRLNQAGVIPIIFAISLVLAPTMIGQFISQIPNPKIGQLGLALTNIFAPNSGIYNLVYFLLVVGFTFFYTAVIFNPQDIANDVKKYGGFVPGIRPGAATADYLNYILTRITLAGAVFLGLIAILPSFVQVLTNISAVALGGTGILIVVSVVLETTKKIEAQVVMRNYDKFISR